MQHGGGSLDVFGVIKYNLWVIILSAKKLIICLCFGTMLIRTTWCGKWWPVERLLYGGFSHYYTYLSVGKVAHGWNGHPPWGAHNSSLSVCPHIVMPSNNMDVSIRTHKTRHLWRDNAKGAISGIVEPFGYRNNIANYAIARWKCARVSLICPSCARIWFMSRSCSMG